MSKSPKEPVKQIKSAANPGYIPASPRFFQVPGPDCISPRDGRSIERTDDYLFIAVLIERSRRTGWLKGESLPNACHQYMPTPPLEPSKEHIPPHHYSTKTLRRILVRKCHFWNLRLHIQNVTAPTTTISIGGRNLCSEGKWQRNDFRRRLSVLLHPIKIGVPDPLLANLHANQFFKWCDLTQAEPFTLSGQTGEPPTLPPDTPKNRKKRELMLSKWHRSDGAKLHHQLICPLDGPVTPIEVRISSPAWTWKNLCGRSSTSLHCPHCLARLHSKIAFMI